jgi:hypothetical protein
VDLAIAELDQLEEMQLGSALTYAAVGLASAQADVLEAMSDRGEAIGARYVLMGSLSGTTSQDSARIPGTSRTLSQNTVNYRLRMRLIDTQNGTLVAANSLEGGLPLSASGADWSEAARFAAGFVRDAIYPVRFVSANPLAISRGSNAGLGAGDQVGVYRLGDEVRDGAVVLGRQSTFVGYARITSVEPEFAILETNISVDDISRFRPSLMPPSQAGASETRNESVIAVGQIEVAQNATISSSMRARIGAVHDAVERRLSAAPGVIVADRDRLEAVFEELDFQSVTSGNVDLGNVIGANYLAFIVFDRLLYQQQDREIAAIGRTESVRLGIAEMRLEVIDVDRGTIAFSTALSFGEGGLNQQSDYESRLGAVIAGAILGHLFPAEIIGTAGASRYYINQGSDRGLRVNNLFHVVRMGDEMTDSTGRSFGRTEQIVGEVRIVGVEDQRAIVELVSGEAEIGFNLRATGSRPADPRRPPTRRPEW